jgi:hypothetical protein
MAESKVSYVVRVVATDADTDSSDAFSSQFFGPYSTLEKAESIARIVESAIVLDCDLQAFVETVKPFKLKYLPVL